MKRLLILGLCIAALCVVGVSVNAWRERENSLRRAAIYAKEQKRRRFEDDVLGRTILLDGRQLALDKFAEEIARQVGTTVVVTEAAKLQYGVESGGHWLIELPRGRYSLRSLLTWLEVEEPDFYVEFDEDKLTVTTAAWPTISNRLQTVVYPLPQPEPAGMNEEDWRDLIKEAVIGWRGNVAGNLFGELVVESVPGAVVVVHDAAGQRKVRWMMERLTALGERETGGLLWPPREADSQRERIRAALNEKSSCRFEDTPLEEAMEQLAAQHGIPIYLREQKLSEGSVALTTPITKSVTGISLRSLLNLILKDFELSYVVEDQELVITTPENAEDHEIIVAYPVRDLVEFGDSHDAVDWDPLVEVMTASVRPSMWEFSGPTPDYGYGDRWLIFQQTDAMHDQVTELLDQMRWVMARKAGAVPPSLRAAQESEERIRTALRRTIELDNEPRPLKEAVARLQEALGIPILVAEKRLEEAGVSLDVPVASDLGTATAGDHLAAMLRAQMLTTVIRDEVLQITTPQDEESHLVTRVYDTRHLLRKMLSADRLCLFITAEIQPGKWDDNGGPGNVESYADLLVVNHTQAIQDEVERYLEKLSKGVGDEKVNDGK